MAALLFLMVTLMSHVLPSYQLGGGCIAEQLHSREEIERTYQLHFPVSVSPSVQAVHLALQGSTAMRVTWLNPTTWSSDAQYTPVCMYGLTVTSLGVNATGEAYSYPDGMFLWVLNTAILNLTSLSSPTGVYYYRCGDPQFGWSSVLNFTLQSPNARNVTQANMESLLTNTVVEMPTAAPAIAVVADMGVKRGEDTMASITKHVNTGEVQLLVHAGDISYADKFGGDSHNNSEVWVEYMNLLQPIVSRVPYMVAPGNHEAQFEFAAYLNWLKMPYEESGSASPFWYSFDYMGIHFVAYSTEHDFSPNSTQYLWMEQDLKKANQNRENVPWIMVFGHRPLYCTSIVCIERCDIEAPRYRANIEDLLYYQNVDIYMSGHNHQYERSYPVYKKRIAQKDYTNSLSPVYIVNGAAGNPELNDPTFMPFVKWRAFDEATFDTGYLLMRPSRWQIQFEYILSKSNKVVDTFTMSKTPY
ncbi:uncharacterized protein [Haliotis asinina]|uniref:uncharacterized protein n=1 Tax=Haliotis asinina TaxID=109174 RepID=UPI00353216F8